MSDTKKYYWLKLKRDFFKRHDIKIIESMENGKDYVLFYLKLLLESVDHDGSLRFSETVPYNDKMLATITDTNIDIVRSAVKIFAELGMMDQFDDGTLFMSQVQTMLGSETSDAVRMREAREKKKQ
jgi:predicted phage replisome organizer